MKGLMAQYGIQVGAMMLALTLSACEEKAAESGSMVKIEGVTTLKSTLPYETNPVLSATEMAQLSANNQRFAFELYQVLRQSYPGENLFYSPYSLMEVMGMASVGAKGDTAAEFHAVLHKGELSELRWHQGRNRLRLNLLVANDGPQAQPPPVLRFGLHAWVNDTWPVEPDFLDTLAVHYDAGIHLVDLARQHETVRHAINTWVAQETEQRVPELFEPGILKEGMPLVLTSTVYFKADWLSAFDPDDTSDEVFYGQNGQNTTISFMSQRGRFAYAEVDGHQVLELPYQGNRYALVVVLPYASDDFASFESQWNADQWARYVGNLTEQDGRIHIPRFQMELGGSFKEAFKALGLAHAFDARADFTGMSPGEDVYIDDLIHKGFIAVDEKGTEAAGASGVTFGDVSAPVSEFTMNVNRPFVFAIRDRSNGELLFVGRYVVAAENP